MNAGNIVGFPLLSLITWLPMVGCLVILTIRGDEKTIASNARWTALWTSLIVLVVSLVIWIKFDRSEAGFQFVENVSWLPEYKVGYKMGIDGISVLFVLLSTVLTPICILASWESIQTKVREFMIAFLLSVRRCPLRDTHPSRGARDTPPIRLSAIATIRRLGNA